MAEEQQQKDMQLDKRISLTGFHDLDGVSLASIKKTLENHVRKLTDLSTDFQGLRLVLKRVHHTDGSDLFDIKGRVNDKGKVFSAEHIDRNIVMTVNRVLEKLQQEMGRR